MFVAAIVLVVGCHPQDGGGTAHDSVHETGRDDSTTPDDSGTNDSGTTDRDGDGWTEPEDCDDDDADVYPEAPEACVDHKDNDCDGVIDSCDLELDLNAGRHFDDPDATHGVVGFGYSMGFLAKGNVSLWISPQGLAPRVFRAASAEVWPAAEISGFEGSVVANHSTIEVDGDFDRDSSKDLVIVDSNAERVAAYLFYDPVVGADCGSSECVAPRVRIGHDLAGRVRTGRHDRRRLRRFAPRRRRQRLDRRGPDQRND
jgi:hypothetical protein